MRRLKAGLVGGLLALPTLAAAQEAPSFQINAQHTGATIFPGGLTLPLKARWSRNFGFGGITYPLIAERLIFGSIANPDTRYGSFYGALSLADGHTVWQHYIPGYYFSSFGAYDNGTIFVLSGPGALYAFDAGTGQQRWMVQLDPNSPTDGAIFNSAPTARDGTVYVAGGQSGTTIYAVREGDGAVQWTTLTDADPSSPTLSEDGLFLSAACADYEFDLATGKQRWAHGAECGGGGATPVLYDQLLFTAGLSANNPNTGTAQLAFNGKVSYGTGDVGVFLARQEGIGFLFPPAFQAGIGYFATGTGVVARSVPANAVLWQYKNPNVTMAPIVVNGTVLAVAANQLVALNGSSGKVLQSIGLTSKTTPCYNGNPPGISAGEGVVAVPCNDDITVFEPSAPITAIKNP